jgi:signal transduction histidine kinase
VQLGLCVSMLASTLGVTLLALGHARYTIGWYAARFDGLVSAGTILFVLFAEMGHLFEAERAARLHAEQMGREQEAFLAVAAHELKTPLTNLRGFAYLLQGLLEKEGALDRDRAARAVRALDDQSGKLDRLVCHLLDLASIEDQTLKLRPEQTDLAQVASDAAAAAQLRTTKHALAVVAPRAVPAFLDALRIEQVLIHLIDNAIRFSPQGGPITVEVGQPCPETVRLSVRDLGIGVPEEKRAHLFERLAPAHADEYRSGLGLGLYISRTIVELHGGTIGASFPAQGGSLFTVELPKTVGLRGGGNGCAEANPGRG